MQQSKCSIRSSYKYLVGTSTLLLLCLLITIGTWFSRSLAAEEREHIQTQKGMQPEGRKIRLIMKTDWKWVRKSSKSFMLNLLHSENVQKFRIIIFNTIWYKVYIACMICMYAFKYKHTHIHTCFHLYLEYKYISKMNLCSQNFTPAN